MENHLIDLAARVESLSGPDREVDAAIHGAIGDDFRRWQIEKLGAFGPAYTASLDAAMTLVPEGMWAEGSLSSPAALEIHAPMTYDPIGKGWAATPALALCAASLRARHAVEGEGHD